MVALFAVLFIPEGFHLISAYDHDGVMHCIGRKTPACAQTLSNFGDGAGYLRSVMPWLTLLPGLIGVALAAPLVLDLEAGTYRLAWTQSLTRGRWVASRIGLALVTALAAAGLLAFLLSWYRAPLDRVYGHWDAASFDLEGIVPIGYALFALGLGLAIGVTWRRTAPAVVTAFLTYIACRLFVDGWLRQRFVSPLSATWNINRPGPPFNLDRAWVLDSGTTDRAGHPFTAGYPVIQSCSRIVGKGMKALDAHCLARHGGGFSHAVWQPASRFWEFQGIEFALFAGVALLLIAFAAWRVLRTD
jgi:hypothetical protein